MHRVRARRALAALILSLAIVTSVPTGLGGIRPAAAADASLVFAVLDLLKNEHVDRPDPVRLLAAALGGLRQALSRAGVTATLPDLAATDEVGARVEFQARFDQALAVAAGRVTQTQLQYAAAQAMAASMGDSHTGFITPERLAERRRQQQNQAGFTGIGILLMPRAGRFYIKLVFPGTPAERSGLRPFDRIVAIDGQSTEGMTTEDVSNRIRGPQGTPVTVVVQRPGQPTPLSFLIVREPIVVPAVEHRMLEGGIGYIRFGQFTQGSANLVRRAIEDLQAQGMRGMLLDLRSNPGGFVAELNRVADMLLPAGLPIYTMDSRRDGRQTQVTRTGPVLHQITPLVVLVDDGTASASELLAAALQEHGRGTLVGTRTAGAVLVSITFPLPGGAGLSVAIARMTTSRGVVLEGNGLRPDVEVELTLEDLDRGVDSQLARGRDELARRLAQAGRPLVTTGVH
ncbi:MAG: S41 family peptidase [Armatimonadota bacterium]|nr:S41 family peptidase [Armatimonadota bacterium]MDR5696954.1 S41 family peptidase [Armatimonadota bacterium]